MRQSPAIASTSSAPPPLLLDDTVFYDTCGPLSTECSCHRAYQYYGSDEKILLGIICFFVITFGLVTNLLSVRIFTSRVMWSTSINWYLAVLTSSDTLVLFAAFFVLTLPRLGEFLQIWELTRLSYAISPYCYGLMTLAQTISVWMTVAMSLHRYVGVCYPFRSVEILNEKNVVRFIGSLLAFSILFNTSRFFEVRVVNDCYRTDIGAIIPVLAPTALRLNPAYRWIFFGWAYTIVMFVVPFAILIVVNTTVLVAIRRSNRLHAQPVPQSEAEGVLAKKTESKERQTTAVLVALVVVFLCCNTLAFLVNIMENLGYDENELYGKMVTYNNFLVIINASSNIFIYMLFSEKYRALLKVFVLRSMSKPNEHELLLTGAVSV